MFDMFSGGALGRMTIFALNIMPYISASIIIQLLTAVSPTLEALKKEGESGRKKLNQYTRYGTVLLAAVQAYGIAVGLEGMRAGAQSAVIDPGLFFRLVTVVTLGRRHGVPDVARRADHRARRRQRHLADHLVRHRRQPAARAGRRPSNSAAPARISTVFIIIFLADVGRRGRVHRVHGARAAPHPGAVPETPESATRCSAAMPRICR